MPDGFNTFTPSSTSKLFYISGVSGDDTAAAAVNGGLGYYNAGDTAIGSDPTNPVGPIVPYATAQAAMAGVTGDRDNGGCDDWVLFARGETFEENTARNSKTEDVGFLQWGPIRPSGNPDAWISGISKDKPFVVTSWGNTGEERPTLSGSQKVKPFFSHFKWVSLRFKERPVSKTYVLGGFGDAEDIYFEDVYFEESITVPLKSWKYDDITFYRCQLVDGGTTFIESWDQKPEHQPKINFTQCIIDRNGWNEDVNDATTWTAEDPRGSSGVTAGTGVQPDRDFFKRNIYCAGHGPDFFLRGNVICRDAGGSSVQMRNGGAAERNAFVFNESALSLGSPETYREHQHSGIAKQNVVLHDDLFRPPGGWGHGINITGHERFFVVDDNIVAHFHRQGNGSGSYSLKGKNSSAKSPAQKAEAAVFKNNIAYQRYGTVGFEITADYKNTNGINSVYFYNNAIAVVYDYILYSNRNNCKILSIDSPNDSVRQGIYIGSLGPSYGNYYHGFTFDSGNQRPFLLDTAQGSIDLVQNAGYETYSSFTGDFEGFKTQVGWVDPERDIISYMTSIDAGYTTDIDVKVDYAIMGPTQSVPQKVYDVLLAAGSGITTDPDRNAWAEQATRRFHAAYTFIKRCRENRKYSWSNNYTADALNNYIREGFGKAPVTGDYGITNVDAETKKYIGELRSVIGNTFDFSGFKFETNNGYTASGVTLPTSAQQIDTLSFKILFDGLPKESTNISLRNKGYIQYQPVYQFTDPNAQGGTIDSSSVLNWMQQNIGSTLPDNTYIMLDFEDPYFSIIQNGNTGSSEYSNAISSMVDLVQNIKTSYPNTRVGYYGIPILPYWNYDLGWYSLSENEKQQVLEEYLDRNYDIMNAVDWLSPIAYERYDRDIVNHGPNNYALSSSSYENEYYWRYNSVELCNMFKTASGSTIDCLPVVSCMHLPSGQNEYNKKLTSLRELTLDQIKSVSSNTGCNGLLFWNSYPFYIARATGTTLEGEALLDQQEIRYAFQQDFFGGTAPDWEGYI